MANYPCCCLSFSFYFFVTFLSFKQTMTERMQIVHLDYNPSLHNIPNSLIEVSSYLLLIAVILLGIMYSLFFFIFFSNNIDTLGLKTLYSHLDYGVFPQGITVFTGVDTPPEIIFPHNAALQDSIRVIQKWFSIFDEKYDLNVTFSNAKFQTMNESEKCTIILVPLITHDRPHVLQIMIDFLIHRDKLCNSQSFAKALAHIIMVAFDLSSYGNPDTQSKTAELLCDSPDSFVFDYVYAALMYMNNTTSIHFYPRLNASHDPGLRQGYCFIYSKTPSIGTVGILFSYVPIVNLFFSSCKIMKHNDVVPLVFKDLVNSKVAATTVVCKKLEKTSSTMCSYKRKSVGDNDVDKTRFKIGAKGEFIAPRDAKFKDITDYRARMLSIKAEIQQLLTSLWTFARIQEYRSIACSPLISPHMVRVKWAYLYMLNSYINWERLFFQFERAFVFHKLCTGDIFISYSGVKSRFETLVTCAPKETLEELNDLTALLKKNKRMSFSLYEAFYKNDSLLDGDLKKECKHSIVELLQDCEKSLVLNEELNVKCKILLELYKSAEEGIYAITSGQVHLDQDDLKKDYKEIKIYFHEHIKHELFTVNYHKFLCFINGKSVNVDLGKEIEVPTHSVFTCSQQVMKLYQNLVVTHLAQCVSAVFLTLLEDIRETQSILQAFEDENPQD